MRRNFPNKAIIRTFSLLPPIEILKVGKTKPRQLSANNPEKDFLGILHSS